jgi:hypothetical protein
VSRLSTWLLYRRDPLEGKTPIQKSEVAYLYFVGSGWEIRRDRRHNMEWFGPYKTIEQAESAARLLGFGSARISRDEEIRKELKAKPHPAEHRRLWGR